MNFMLRMIVRSYSFVNLLSGLIFFLIFNKFAKFLYCRLLLLGRILFPVRVKNFGLFFFLYSANIWKKATCVIHRD